MFLNLYGLFCQFLHFFVGSEKMSRCSCGTSSILTCLPSPGSARKPCGFFSTPWCGARSRAIRRQCRFVHVKLIRVNRPCTTISPRPHAEVINTTWSSRIRYQWRTSRQKMRGRSAPPLNTGGERHSTVIVTLVHTIEMARSLNREANTCFTATRTGQNPER